MREVKFILPCRTSAPSTDLEHRFAREALIDAFGGYTLHNSKGGWRNGEGDDILEHRITYVVAICQSDGLGNFARFREIAIQAGRMAEQEAVYIVGPTGDAEIVSLVDVGKEIVRGEAKTEVPRQPQVGDFWETADGSKVYVDHRITSLNGFGIRIIKCGGRDWPPLYTVNHDGTHVGLDYAGGHPLDLKRFIGR